MWTAAVIVAILIIAIVSLAFYNISQVEDE
jgi:hypothetical protein